MKGETEPICCNSLESRLDNVVYRLSLHLLDLQAAKCLSQALSCQWETVNIPSYVLKPGDVVSVRNKSKKLDIILESMKRIKGDMD